MELDWEQLVVERNAWIEHNFPNEMDNNPGLASVMGVIEELGELAHAHLKEDQAIRGTAKEHQAAAKDAIGDISVYLLGVMNRWSLLPFGTAPKPGEQFSPHEELLHLTYFVGELSRAHMEQVRIRVGPATSCIVLHLRRYCHARGWDYDLIVRRTWNGVRQRDWIKFPHDGLTR